MTGNYQNYDNNTRKSSDRHSYQKVHKALPLSK